MMRQDLPPQYNPGDRLRATDVNALTDGIVGLRKQTRPPAMGPQRMAVEPAQRVRVRNATGSARAKLDIVGLGGATFTGTTATGLDTRVVDAELPYIDGTGSGGSGSGSGDSIVHTGRWAVLADALQPNEIGWAYYSGICRCVIYMDDESHEYADIVDGEAEFLLSAASGAARILYAEPGTGLVDAVISIGAAADTIRPLYKATADEEEDAVTGIRSVEAKRVAEDGTVDTGADPETITIHSESPHIFEGALFDTYDDRNGDTVAVAEVGTLANPFDYTYGTTQRTDAWDTYETEDTTQVIYDFENPPATGEDGLKLSVKTSMIHHANLWVDSVGRIVRITAEKAISTCPDATLFYMVNCTWAANTVLYCTHIDANLGPQFAAKTMAQLYAAIVASNEVSGADQAAVTLGNTDGEIGGVPINIPVATPGNTDNEIGGLTFSSTVTQAECEALRDKCEELADDVRNINDNAANKADVETLRGKCEELADDMRNLSTLVHAIRDALITLDLIKGSA